MLEILEESDLEKKEAKPPLVFSLEENFRESREVAGKSRSLKAVKGSY
jgi:hypothetical protein